MYFVVMTQLEFVGWNDTVPTFNRGPSVQYIVVHFSLWSVKTFIIWISHSSNEKSGNTESRISNTLLDFMSLWPS